MKRDRGHNSLSRNALLNTIKQVCAIAFPLVTIAYASRVLGSEQIGIYSFSHTFTNYFSIIAALGISSYAIREGSQIRENRARLQSFANEVFSINILTSVAAYIALYLVAFCLPSLAEYRKVIIITSISISLVTLGADWINSIYEDYFYITTRYIVIQVLALVAMFLFVKNNDDVYKYALISILASSGGNIINFFYIRKYVSLKFTIHLRIKNHLPPMLILFFNNLASVIYLNSDTTILGLVSGNVETGIYSISAKVYSTVKQLLNAVITVTLPRFSNLLAKGEVDLYNQLASKIMNFLISLILPCTVGIFFEAPNILYVFAGEEYVAGSVALRILSVAMFFAVASCFLSYSVLMPNHREKNFMIATVSAASVNIILNLLIIPYIGMNGAALTTLIAEIVVFVITGISSRGYIRLYLDKKSLVCTIIGSVFIFVICKGMAMALSGVVAELFASVILSVLVYAVFFAIGSWSTVKGLLKKK